MLCLADVHLAVFAPAFPLSFYDSEHSRKPPMPIASVVAVELNLLSSNQVKTTLLPHDCIVWEKSSSRSVFPIRSNVNQWIWYPVLLIT